MLWLLRMTPHYRRHLRCSSSQIHQQNRKTQHQQELLLLQLPWQCVQLLQLQPTDASSLQALQDQSLAPPLQLVHELQLLLILFRLKLGGELAPPQLSQQASQG
jgi:hypothetical protein